IRKKVNIVKQREMETVQLVRYSKSYVFFKRILDIVLSTVLLLLLSPVLLLVSLLLYMDDGSPVIFKQTRIGLGEKPFVLLKFRTMPWVAPFLNDEKEDSKKHWIHGVPDDFVFKSSCPSETTKLGEFLRKYSVDELPQLINVVKGDMSLVGPRPEVSNITDYYNVEQKKRLLVKPGLTGYAQVHGRSGLTHGEKISSDLYYVESRSLKLDIRILLLTVKHVFKAENTFYIQDFLYIIGKRIKLVIIIPIACAIAGFLISVYLISPVYQAQVDLLVNQTYTEETDTSTTTDVEMNLRLIETYQFIISSSKIRGIVYEELDGKYSLDDLKKNLVVETSPDSQIINLHAKADTPGDASKLVNTFALASQEEIADLMEMENVRILSEAKPDNFQNPVRPNPILNTGVSFLAGLVFVFNFIAISDYLNTKIRSRQDVERYLRAPLLGTIGMFESNKQKEISLTNIGYLVSKV